MSNIDQIIWISIDKVFDKLMPEDKARFYHLLKEKYHFNTDSVAQTYSIFHLALKENYRLKYYEIERQIIKTMHDDTLNGKYELTTEIEAFSVMTAVILEDQNNTIKRMKDRLDELDRNRGNLEQELFSNVEHKSAIEKFFKEIESQQKGKLT